jgi:hypothetical protein
MHWLQVPLVDGALQAAPEQSIRGLLMSTCSALQSHVLLAPCSHPGKQVESLTLLLPNSHVQLQFQLLVLSDCTSCLLMDADRYCCR